MQSVWHKRYAFEVSSLLVCVEGCLCRFQSVLDFCCLSCSSNVFFLSKVPCTVAFVQNIYLDVVNRDFVLLHFCLVAEDLLFCSGVFSKSQASVLLLKSRNTSSNLCGDVENNSTSSANRKFVRHSLLSLSQMPFCFSCHRFRSSS